MTNEVQVTVRVPADVPDRADALAERMAAKPELRSYRVTKSSVLRDAILLGLDRLEEVHGKSKRRGG